MLEIYRVAVELMYSRKLLLVATEQSTVKTSQYSLNKEQFIFAFARTKEKKETNNYSE